METYTVFKRKPYKRQRNSWGTSYVPHTAARCTTVRTGLTEEEARALCKQGPANIARDAGREYRGLHFYEYTRVGR